MQIKETSNFPVICRSGRTSEELKNIIETLLLSSKNGKPYSINNIEFGNKYNSMQQRIRAQAKKLNLNVQIHFDKNNSTLYFRVPSKNTTEIENLKKANGNLSQPKEAKKIKTTVKK